MATKTPKRKPAKPKPHVAPEIVAPPAVAEAEIPQPQPPAQPKTIYVSFSAEINFHTTEALLGLMAQQVMQGVERVYLMLSTPGGQVTCGINIYNVLRAMPFHLITHNVGNVDSIGNVVFLAGIERYACPHSTFMFHGVGFDITQPVRFEQKALREHLQSIDSDHTRIGTILTERTRLNAEEVNRLFLEAQTKNAEYALANGIVHKIGDVKIPPGGAVMQLVFKR